MKAYKRLLDYVSVWTTSEEGSDTVPSAKREFDLAHKLVQELHEIGVANAEVDDKCYIYGSIPATEGCEDKPVIGFIAHMDTAPEFSGKDVKPQIIENYDGKDVVLGDSGRVISVKDFPHLTKLAGRTLITADGTTLLGADDKAGIAEIMTALDEIIKEGLPHGKICVAFTPDEEIGSGPDNFDVERFGAQYGYTLDGWQEGEIQYENFNASTAIFTVHGVNVHPGSAKDIMVNAQFIAMEINGMIPENETPATTEGYEGFYHLYNSEGAVEYARLTYMVRDHDREKFEKREAFLQEIAEKMNEKYGEGTVELVINEGYRNMKEMVEPCFHLIENAKKAIENVGVEPDVSPIRGGTDGARLSFMGLPCPNLGTGGYAYHGPMEHITVEAMDKVVEITKEIIRIYAES
ncbi:peptidase T [Bariatricus massiliensis]|uniref:Peptidase T n=1 Tax=Bariatricus massiliensis TaxID=1745713 RepID=A0ABS8DG56_9FIRM|nr:peptidase T [Bariatricus massiliensis]MCB7304260.1 peptidase T [Bariatricus massiliensis]MCB7374911.1 peptidase T [Bariatricus massiliensis]MCB7387370.1 peptidase T [Bariatricus massiliensis]MCB7411532.1 peptidase T [Bariatricus massiliensis]MCQ5253667.1 peptidase T [Bariatricus massiliensis]